MRWNKKIKSYDGWWWAWYPVRIEGTRTMVWRERVYRVWHQPCEQGFYTYYLTDQG